MLPRRSLIPFAIAAAILCGGASRAANPPPDPLRDAFVQPTPLGSKLDARLHRFAGDGLSGAVLVAKDGLVVVHEAFGLADRDAGIPNRVDTPFPIGPLSRQFTAAAILRLEMDGRLSTADRVDRYLPGARLAKPDATIHDLLSGPAPGYELLPQVIEAASGESYEVYVGEHLFRPARMTATFFEGDAAAGRDRARGYEARGAALRRASGLPGFRVLLPLFEPSIRGEAATLRRVAGGPAPARGAEGIVSTVGDLFLWDLALRGEEVLSETAKDQLYNPIDNSVAYGWRLVRTHGGTSRLESGGTFAGYEAGFTRYPNDELVVILLLNNDMGWRAPVERAVESLALGSNLTIIYAVAAFVVLYIVLRTAMNRRVPYPFARRRRTRRIFD